MSPGPVSDTYQGPPDDGPYVPNWCFPNGEPKMCPCGHHEGYHRDDGKCLHAHQFTKCGCTGIPADCVTSEEEWANDLTKGEIQ